MIMDRGFYSKTNIDELLKYSHKFTIRAPIQRKWIKSIIDDYYDEIEMPDNYQKIEGETLYAKTKLYSWGENNKRSYVHVYYNAYAAASAFDKFTKQLLSWKEELENEIYVKDMKNTINVISLLRKHQNVVVK